MNGDGLKDLITGELEGRVVYAYRKENGELDSLKILEVNNTPLIMNDGISCEVVDLNGDNLFDLIISSGNRMFCSMRIYYNKGTIETFKFTDYVEPLFNGKIFEAQYSTVESSDLDNDGDFDLIFSATNEAGTVFQVFYSENIGTAANAEFSNLVEVEVTIDGTFNTAGYQGNRKNGLALGDLNGDGKPELALGGGSYGKCFQMYINESETKKIISSVKKSNLKYKNYKNLYYMINGKMMPVKIDVNKKNQNAKGIYVDINTKEKMILK